jgi:hypothetical protein
MSIYLLVEGKTENMIYPRWLSIMLGNYERVEKIEHIVKPNHYCLEIRGGADIEEALDRAVQKIKINKITIDYFVFIFDSEEEKITTFEDNFKTLISKYSAEPFRFKLIIQPVSIESWLLGNRKIHPSSVDSELRACLDFYDTKKLDPELIPMLNKKMSAKHNTRAQFYKFYLKKIAHLKTKGKLSYNPPYINFVVHNNYFEEIKARTKSNSDMIYFNEMFKFFEGIKASFSK